MRLPRTPLAVLVRFTVLAASIAAMSGVLSPAAAQARSSTLESLQRTGQQAVTGYMTPSSPSDPRYYSRGTWHAQGGPSCWYCYDSAAVAAATLSEQPGGSASMEPIAVATFNDAIAHHQLSNGAFADANGVADGIGTGFFTVDLGIAYLELQSKLNAQTRARWSNAIGKAAQYLIDSGNTTWYVNGNINFRQTEVMWLAWVATHKQQFLTAYNNEYSFTIDPPQSRWRGFGLHLTKVPHRSDGSDGAGYLAESGGGTPGFDPIYTDAQLDTATDLYVLTKDPKYLRLMNLLFNQLRPRIDSSWTLNGTHGTRENYMTPFMNPALSVLAASGDRPDLVADVPGQMARIALEYQKAQTFTSVNFYKGFESWISMPLLSSQWPAGMAPDRQLASMARTATKVYVRTASRNGTASFMVTVNGLSSGATVRARLLASRVTAATASAAAQRSTVQVSLRSSLSRLQQAIKSHMPLLLRVTIVTGDTSRSVTKAIRRF